MESKRNIMIEELKRIASLPTYSGRKLKRGDFLSNLSIPINRKDIEKEFESFENFCESNGVLPYKSYRVPDEKLFQEYGKAYELLGHYPLGGKGLAELSKITRHSSIMKKRFGGLKNLLFEYKSWLSKPTYEIIVNDGVAVTDQIEIEKLKPKVKEFENFENKGRYIGQATENLVIAELLFRGFNAHKVTIDEGIDVSATYKEKSNDFQVKHSYYEDSGRASISLTLSSFNRNKRNNVYYIVVLEGRKNNKKDFIILPYTELDKYMKLNPPNEQSKNWSVPIFFENSNDDDKKKAFIIRRDEDHEVSKYINAWDVLLGQ